MANEEQEFDLDSAVESIRMASLAGLLQTITLDQNRECTDFESYLRRLRTRVIRELYLKLAEYKAIKAMLEIDAEYSKPEIVKQEGGALERARKAQKRREYEKYEPDKEVASIGLITKLRPITHASQVPQMAEQMLEDLRERHITKLQNGSGFMIRAIVQTVLKVAQHTPLAGSSYLPLPTFLVNKKRTCIVNVRNTDQRCFGYSILASIREVVIEQNPENPVHYTERDFELYHLDQLDYPVQIEDLPEIERMLDIPINVFSFFDDEGKGRMPIYTSKLDDPQTATDLLFWENDGVGHFAWIRNFSAFVHDLIIGGKKSVHWCKRCFSHFYSWDKFQMHLNCCCGVEGYKCIHKLPEEGTTLEFKNPQYTQKVPFVVYVDFEAITKKVTQQPKAAAAPPPPQPPKPPVVAARALSVDDDSIIVIDDDDDEDLASTPARTPPPVGDVDDDEQDSQREQPRPKPTHVYQEHVPISVGVKLVSIVPGVLDDLPYETYTGGDVAKWLLEKLLDYQVLCIDFLEKDKGMNLTMLQEVSFQTALQCYVCGKPFDKAKKGCGPVRDHDHVSGEYRGAAHDKCNLKLKRQVKIPIFCHNFRGYDSHLIVPALGLFKDEKLDVIAQTLEKYLTVSFSKHLAFKDSFQFMTCSLDRLTQNLLTSGKQNFVHMREGFKQYNENTFELLLRKGVYPYDYMDDEKHFVETALPPRAAFFSRLRQQECSQEDYDHACNVWNTFACKTLLDYHNLYLKCDVLQLADVYESFRETSRREYRLDPAHYVSAPHLTWDAMLYSTGCSLDLLYDDAMYSMIQQNLRGGVAMISKRRGTANNKYMKDNYDPAKPSKYLLYVDANNLYGWSMSQPLPDRDFKWLNEQEWDQIDWLSQTSEQQRGYIVECDLEYPDELHDAHSDYPLAPERMKVEMEQLSEQQRDIHGMYDNKSLFTEPKLIPNLYGKKQYACHYMNLKFYLEQGMKLTKIHRVVSFHQSKWLEPYITKNSTLRAAATNNFEKDFYKLMNNAVYGKTTENVLNRKDIRLEHDRAKAKKLIDKPHCIGFRIFTPDISAIALQKTAAKIDKPTYVGFAVLEYAKLLMYNFHYGQVLKQWPDGKARLVMTDTDSLLYEIATEDVYEDISNNAGLKEWFDTSNYPKDHPLYTDANKMVIGKMKDEAAGQIMVDVVGLRAKMYSFKVFNPRTDAFSETCKAKGIQKAAMADISHEDYVQQLTNPHENRVTVRRIGHMFHIVLTYEQSKRALCAFDDKRYLHEDLIDTYAHGHYKIRPVEEQPETPVPARTRTSMPVFEDEDGDLHLVVTHAAARTTPALSALFASQPDAEFSDDGDDDDDMVRFDDDDGEEPVGEEPQPADADDEESPPARHAEPRRYFEDREHQHVLAPPPAKRARNCYDSRRRNLAVEQESNKDSTSRRQAENAKANFSYQFAPADYAAAETLIEYAMVNIGNPVHASDKQRAPAELRSRLAGKSNEPQSSTRSRALELLNEARGSNKNLALTDCERFLFAVVKATKVVGAQYWRGGDKKQIGLTHPHKLLFTLLSGRSDGWYDKHHKKLLDSMGMRK